MFEEHCTTQQKNLKSVAGVCVMVVTCPIVPLTDAPAIVPAVDPAAVFPPLDEKSVIADAPLPDTVAVSLGDGMKTASIEQDWLMACENGLSVDATGPFASA